MQSRKELFRTRVAQTFGTGQNHLFTTCQVDPDMSQRDLGPDCHFTAVSAFAVIASVGKHASRLLSHACVVLLISDQIFCCAFAHL